MSVVLLICILLLTCLRLTLQTKCVANVNRVCCVASPCGKHDCATNSSCWNCSMIQHNSGKCARCWADVCSKTGFINGTLRNTDHLKKDGTGTDKTGIVFMALLFFFAFVATLLVIMFRDKCLRNQDLANRTADEELTSDSDVVVGDVDENLNQFVGEETKTVQSRNQERSNITAHLLDKVIRRMPDKGNVNDVFYRIPSRESTNDEIATVTVHKLYQETVRQIKGDGDDKPGCSVKVDIVPNKDINDNTSTDGGDKNHQEGNGLRRHDNGDEARKLAQQKQTQDKGGSTNEKITYFPVDEKKMRTRKDNCQVVSQENIDDQVC